jgi:D-sedoheptulose 7-phosphate isomerase
VTSPEFEIAALEHVRAAVTAVGGCVRHLHAIEAWGSRAATTLLGGGRLLAAGNGGSAAHAQHLTSELVGRYRDERVPLSALALHAETSTLTAIMNDYGADEVFARQVRAHGRAGDLLVVFSTSGASADIVAAARAARAYGVTSWAFTGPGPNPLVDVADASIAIDAPDTAIVQEAHQLLVHLLCEAIDLQVRNAVVEMAR